MDFERSWRVIVAFRWPIVLLTLAAFVSATALSYVLPEKYQGTALILVRPQQRISLTPNAAGKELLDYPVSQLAPIDAPSKTYIEVIKSRRIAEEIVRGLGLDKKTRPPSDSYLKEMWNRTKEWAKDAIIATRQILKHGWIYPLDPFMKAVDGIEKGLTLRPTKDTYIFEITHSASNPGEAADVANMAARVFSDYMRQLTESEAGGTRKFIEERLNTVSQELLRARQDLERYKERHRVLDLKEESSSKVRMVFALRSDVETLDAKLTGVLRQYTPSHPKVVAMQAERDKLMETLSRLEREHNTQAEKEKELDNLRLRVKLAEDKYEFLSKEDEDARIQEGNLRNEIRVVSAAVPALVPAGPVKYHYAVAGLAGGLLLALTLVFFMEFRDRRLRTLDDVTESLQLPILTSIPPFKAGKG
jgi:uncharacterized protein involved in exopolysaccharide biosynthesis